MSVVAGKIKKKAVIVNNQIAQACPTVEPYKDIAGAAVFAHVGEGIWNDPGNLSAYGGRQHQGLTHGNDSRGNARIPAESVREIDQKRNQLAGTRLCGAELSGYLTQPPDFLSNGNLFFQAEDGIRLPLVTGVQTCALPI